MQLLWLEAGRNNRWNRGFGLMSLLFLNFSCMLSELKCRLRCPSCLWNSLTDSSSSQERIFRSETVLFPWEGFWERFIYLWRASSTLDCLSVVAMWPEPPERKRCGGSERGSANMTVGYRFCQAKVKTGHLWIGLNVSPLLDSSASVSSPFNLLLF